MYLLHETLQKHFCFFQICFRFLKVKEDMTFDNDGVFLFFLHTSSSFSTAQHNGSVSSLTLPQLYTLTSSFKTWLRCWWLVAFSLCTYLHKYLISPVKLQVQCAPQILTCITLDIILAKEKPNSLLDQMSNKQIG